MPGPGASDEKTRSGRAAAAGVGSGEREGLDAPAPGDDGRARGRGGLRTEEAGETLARMRHLLCAALLVMTSLGCARTAAPAPAPGQPAGEALVVTYYYLNF